MNYEACVSVFTLSLDCEGLWGIADHPNVCQRTDINRESLRKAYRFIADVLNQNGLRATTAFVSSFAAENSVIQENIALYQHLAKLQPQWFRNIMKALDGNQMDGWNGHEAYRIMADAGMEIAWHGGTHVPLNSVPIEALNIELELSNRIFDALNHKPSTIIFPRNKIAYLKELRSAGFSVFRNGYDDDTLITRACNVIKELNTRPVYKSVRPKAMNGWCICDPGIFLNWPSGIRALVPATRTVSRWSYLLRKTAELGGHMHMWFHPHNLITAPEMKETFLEIMRIAGGMVRHGDLVCRTMSESARACEQRL